MLAVWIGWRMNIHFDLFLGRPLARSRVARGRGTRRSRDRALDGLELVVTSEVCWIWDVVLGVDQEV